MTYNILLTPTAEEDLKKFDRELQRRFYKRIEKLKIEPSVYGKPLK